MPRIRKIDAHQAELFAIDNGDAPKSEKNSSSRAFASQQSLASYIWSTCDILRRSNCAGALQYVPELTWILFLRILDEREEQESAEAQALGRIRKLISTGGLRRS